MKRRTDGGLNFWGAIIVAGWAAVCSSASAAEGQPGDTATAKSNQCIGCHEIPGYRTVFPEVYLVPKISGQSAAYIESALKSYRAGKRSHPSMVSIAAQLSDEDIRQLAVYYSEKGE